MFVDDIETYIEFKKAQKEELNSEIQFMKRKIEINRGLIRSLDYEINGLKPQSYILSRSQMISNAPGRTCGNE